MTIEIHKPELETLILERIKSGGFDIEEVLIKALKSSPTSAFSKTAQMDETRVLTGADLVAVMQASPYREANLEPVRERLPVRDVVF